MIFGEDDSRLPGSQPAGQGQAGQQLRVDISQMETTYANFFALAGSADEIVLYLGANAPLPGVANAPMRITERVIMLPQNAKRLLIALDQTVKAHEDRFGPIEIAPTKRPEGPSRP
jgi:hypothetical protein